MADNLQERAVKALLFIVSVAWGIGVTALLIDLAAVLPGDVRPHAVRYPLQFLFMIIGAVALVWVPLDSLWEYITGKDKD